MKAAYLAKALLSAIPKTLRSQTFDYPLLLRPIALPDLAGAVLSAPMPHRMYRADVLMLT